MKNIWFIIGRKFELIWLVGVLSLVGCVKQKDGAENAQKVLGTLANNIPLTSLAGVKVTNAVEMELRGWKFYIRGYGSPELFDSVMSSDEWGKINGYGKTFLTKKLPWWKPEDLDQCYVFAESGSKLGFNSGPVIVLVGISEREKSREVVVYIEVASSMRPF